MIGADGAAGDDEQLSESSTGVGARMQMHLLDPALRPQTTYTPQQDLTTQPAPKTRTKLAFTSLDKDQLVKAGTKTIPRVEASLSPSGRAKALLTANKDSPAPDQLSLVLGLCGFGKEESDRMEDGFDELHAGEDTTCADVLSFLGGDSKAG